jgi:cobalt/nickel transport system permease protein
MHIPENMLPASQALGWAAASGVVLARAVREYRCVEKKLPQLLPMLGILGAAVFVMSMVHIPIPFTGTSAHMIGVPLAALLVGPWLSALLALTALILQALLLGEGGLTTLGANVFAMGIAGSFTVWYVYLALRRLKLAQVPAIFLAAICGDIAVYLVSALQLVPVVPGGSAAVRYAALLLALMPVQLPIALMEGVVTAGIYSMISRQRPALMEQLGKARGQSGV